MVVRMSERSLAYKGNLFHYKESANKHKHSKNSPRKERNDPILNSPPPNQKPNFLTLNAATLQLQRQYLTICSTHKI